MHEETDNTAPNRQACDCTNDKPAFCPRCSYNLQGSVSTWVKAGCCPFYGQCSECGLGLSWRDVFVESDHPWLFEYHWRRKPIRSFLKTARLAFRPAEFWQSVTMSDKMNLRVQVLVIIIPLVMLIITRFVLALVSYNLIRPIGSGFYFLDLFDHWKWRGFSWYTIFGIEFDRMVIAVICWSILVIICFYLLPVSIRRAKVRRIHLWRIMTYSLLPCTIFLLAIAVMDAILTVLNGYYFSISYNTEVLLDQYVDVTCLMLWFLWTIRCYWMACKHYLKLPHAFLIGVLLPLTSGLLLLTTYVIVMSMIYPGWLWDLKVLRNWIY